MWVWKKLGFDSVFELPLSTLENIGRRCRVADNMQSKRSDALFEGIRDETGAVLEFCETKGSKLIQVDQELKGTPQPWQLAPAGRNGYICLPGSMDLKLEPDLPKYAEPCIIDSTGEISGLRTVKDNLEKIVDQGGSFTWRIPKAEAHLTEMAESECCNTPGPGGWPMSVVGAVIGAELHVTAIQPGSEMEESIRPKGGDGSLENEQISKAALVQEHIIQCKRQESQEAFKLHVLQRGGPPLDPARLHGVGEDEVAMQVEKWSKYVAKKPYTWRTLFVVHERSATAPDSMDIRSNVLEQPCHGRQPNDVVLAATATSELVLEPFELSYGDEHIKSIRRMLEDEVACILGLKRSQVLCGDLHSKGKGPRQRHLRRDTVGFRFALLQEELANAREDAFKSPLGPRSGSQVALQSKARQKRSSVLPPIGDFSEGKAVLSKTQVNALDEASSRVGETTANSMTVALKQTMEAASIKAEVDVIETMVRDARKGKKSTRFRTLTQAEDSVMSLESVDYDQFDRTRPLGARSMSAPDLTIQSPGPLSPQDRSISTTATRFRSASIETMQETQPDHLLKELIKALSDKNHPLQRHFDVFPVLARIPKGKTALSQMLVSHENTLKLNTVADSFKEAITNRYRPKKKSHKDTDEVDAECDNSLVQMRAHVLEIEARPDSDLAARREKLHSLSPKALLDMMEASYNLYKDLTVCLDVQIEQTEAGEDVSVKLRSHSGVTKISFVMEQFKADRQIVEKGMIIFSNMTRHDPGTIDSIFEEDVAPIILDALKCFPKSRTLQLHGCRVMRVVYDLARKKALQGRPVVLLGKHLPEVWTFQGISHIILTMQVFQEDAEISLELFNMLVPLTDTLANNGMAVDVFNAVQKAMRWHSDHADLLAHGIHAIARLGTSFMSHERKGIRPIIEAMARHRSVVKLQRVGNKALFALASQQDSLKRCRRDGAVSAIVAAMAAHHKDQQVLQMGARCLEKYCPRGLCKMAHICGDIVSVLPIVLWRTDPVDHNPPAFNLATLRAEFDFDPYLLDNFHSEILMQVDPNRPPSPPSGDGKADTSGVRDKDNLATLTGYRRVGLRDEFDGSDFYWAVPGPPPLWPPVRVAHNVTQNDIKKMNKAGVDIEPQLVAGPRRGHVKSLVEAMQDGLGIKKVVTPAPKPRASTSSVISSASAAPAPPSQSVVTTTAPSGMGFGPEDAELFACILGHFSWHNLENATALVGCGGVGVILKWLRCDHFTGSLDPTEASIVYPMQRACLVALSSVCRHGTECAGALLSEGAHTDILALVDHHDIGMRRSALRCLARLLPHSIKRTTSNERLTPQQVWPVILKQLTDEDEAVRAAAAAIALEAVVADWAHVEKFEEQESGEKQLYAFIDGLVSALQRAVQNNAAAAALPVLLTLAQLSEDDNAVQLLHDTVGLLSLLTTWPPRSAEAAATGIDRAAAAAAAKALETLCEQRVVELSVRDLQMLLTCASSDYTRASPTLCEALEAALAIAVSHVEDTGFGILAQLLGTQVKASNGRHKLASTDSLVVIAQKLAELLDKAPGKNAGSANDVLVAALDHVQPLFDMEVKGEDNAHLKTLLQELRNHCAGSSYTATQVFQQGSDNSPEPPTTPVGNQTVKLPAIPGAK
jgi:hypothetical protein